MNKQDNHEANNQQSIIEDLTVNQDQATAVKGGPIYIRVDGIAGDVTSAGHEKWIDLSGGPVSGGNSLKTA